MSQTYDAQTSLSAEHVKAIIAVLDLTEHQCEGLDDAQILDRLVATHTNLKGYVDGLIDDLKSTRARWRRLLFAARRIREIDNDQHETVPDLMVESVKSGLRRSSVSLTSWPTALVAREVALHLATRHYVRVCSCSPVGDPVFDSECLLHGEF